MCSTTGCAVEGQAAGVEFFPDTTVTGIDPEGAVRTTAGEFRARLIFGADGRNSIVARQRGLMPPPRRCHRIAWQTTRARATRARPSRPPADFRGGLLRLLPLQRPERRDEHGARLAPHARSPRRGAPLLPHFPEARMAAHEPDHARGRPVRVPGASGWWVTRRAWWNRSPAKAFTSRCPPALLAAESALQGLKEDRIETALTQLCPTSSPSLPAPRLGQHARAGDADRAGTNCAPDQRLSFLFLGAPVTRLPRTTIAFSRPENRFARRRDAHKKKRPGCPGRFFELRNRFSTGVRDLRHGHRRDDHRHGRHRDHHRRRHRHGIHHHHRRRLRGLPSDALRSPSGRGR